MTKTRNTAPRSIAKPKITESQETILKEIHSLARLARRGRKQRAKYIAQIQPVLTKKGVREGFLEEFGLAAEEVLAERVAQEQRWGEQNHDPFTYLTILGEEYGEMCQAALKARFESGPEARELWMANLRKETVQTAAVAMAIVECLDRGRWVWDVLAGETCSRCKGRGIWSKEPNRTCRSCSGTGYKRKRRG